MTHLYHNLKLFCWECSGDENEQDDDKEGGDGR